MEEQGFALMGHAKGSLFAPSAMAHLLTIPRRRSGIRNSLLTSRETSEQGNKRVGAGKQEGGGRGRRGEVNHRSAPSLIYL